LKGLLKGFWWPFRSSKSVKYSQSYSPNEVCNTKLEDLEISSWQRCTGVDVTAAAEEWQSASTKKKYQDIFHQHGIHWSPFHQLFYHNPV